MSKKRKKPGPDRISPYTEEMEEYIGIIYEQLSEKERRKYAAAEALKIPKGGQSYIAGVVGCGRNTIRRGIAELKNSEKESEGRIRKKGAGRKSSLQLIENIDDVFVSVIEDHTAGDPMNGNIRRTDPSREKIAERTADAGIGISVTVVKKLLGKHGFVRRKAFKNKRTGSSENRNGQFEKTARLEEEYSDEGNPVVSTDTKKKSLSETLIVAEPLAATELQKCMTVIFHTLLTVLLSRTQFTIRIGMRPVRTSASPKTQVNLHVILCNCGGKSTVLSDIRMQPRF